MSSTRTAAFAAVRMAHRFPRRAGAVGAGGVGIGSLSEVIGWTDPAMILIPGGLTLTAGATAYWWLRYVGRPHSTRALIGRRAELDQRTGGVASWLDVAEVAGVQALRARATVLRPSLSGLSRRQRRRIDPRELGVEIARLGWNLPGQRIWSSNEDATLRCGGPRTGKTLSLACHGIDAPGALITTSTRLDLAEMVQQARSAHGAVHVFNPAGLGDLPSTVRWRVLSGCEDFTTAQRRASDLVPESRGEAERWDAQARRILAILLHAAELSGRSMRDVVRWTSDNGQETQREVSDALLDGGVGGRDRIQALRIHWGTNDRTRTSITTTMATPLAWVNDDRARQLGDAPRDDPQVIDLTSLIARRETLHLIGHEDHTALSPLIAALVAEIAHAARNLAATQPGGRLDPPLTMLLDEAALVCPVPLDRWTADMGGRGVTLHISAQSLSQLRQRWGYEGAGTILANVSAFLVFGGSPSSSDLRDISALTGEHRMRVVGADHTHDIVGDGERRGEYRWVPVLSPSQIRSLQAGQVLVMRRGLHTVVGWAPKVTDRKGWKPEPLAPAVAPPPLERPSWLPPIQRQTGPEASAANGHGWDNADHSEPDTQPDGIPLPTDTPGPTPDATDRRHGRQQGGDAA